MRELIATPHDGAPTEVNTFDNWSGWDVPRVASNTPGELVIHAQDNGCYLAPARVAGHWGDSYAPIAGLLDSGSTRTAISLRLAKSLGLTLGRVVSVKTAGGTVQGRTALITMCLGTIQVLDWPVVVLPMERSLLIGNDLLMKLDGHTLPHGKYCLQG